MANELSLTISAVWQSLTISALNADFDFGDSLDVAGVIYDEGVQTIGTSEETLAFKSDLGTKGYLFIVNLDTTNFVDFGTATGVYPFSLIPDSMPVGVLPLKSTTTNVFLKADTSACNVKYLQLEI